MRFARLFSPRSIAIIGGGVWGENVVKHCLNLGFDGALWPVHPREKMLGGVEAISDIAHLPASPDAAYICVNRHASVDAVRALAKMGCGGVVCLAAGFREASAEDEGAGNLQDALLNAAGDMPLIGPNCYGFINYLDRISLWPDQQGGMPRETGVAVLTQSSNIAMNLTMLGNGLPLSHVFAVGNQAQTDMAELASALIDDERVRAIGLHIEGVKDIRNFEALALRAYAAKKPVIALKVGRSEAAQAATISHTASLAGSHKAAEAFFKRLGFAQVDSLPDFVEALKLAFISGKLAHGDISSMSCSGGEASLIADLAQGRDLSFPPLEARTKTELRDALGPMVALANPLDYHTYIWRDEDKLAEVFTAMARGNHAINLVILDFPRQDRCDDRDWLIVVAAIIRAKAATGAHFGIVATLPDNLRETHAERLLGAGIVPFAGIVEALSAIEALAKLPMPAKAPVLMGAGPQAARRYEEAEAKLFLKHAGINIPRSKTCETAEGAAKIAASIGGPVVLKGQGFAHKSEAGAVCLDLGTPEAVRKEAEAMNAKAYLVEEMVEGAIVEMIIGVTRDAAHGMMLTLGAGGVLTEVLGDTASLLIPATREEIDAALGRLRIAPLLTGYRGKPAIDREALLEAILCLQEFVMKHHGEIDEIEINPLLCGPDFAIAADALIIGNLKGGIS